MVVKSNKKRRMRTVKLSGAIRGKGTKPSIIKKAVQKVLRAKAAARMAKAPTKRKSLHGNI